MSISFSAVGLCTNADLLCCSDVQTPRKGASRCATTHNHAASATYPSCHPRCRRAHPAEHMEPAAAGAAPEYTQTGMLTSS